MISDSQQGFIPREWVHCADGDFFAQSEHVAALAEAIESSSGRLTVCEAASLVERWQRAK